jgi:hypothetical protein
MKTLHQLFHILKFHILIYPTIFIGILLYCSVVATPAGFYIKSTRLWNESPDMFLSYITLFLLSYFFLQQRAFSEDQRFALIAWPQSAASDKIFSFIRSGSFFWTRALDRNLIGDVFSVVPYAPDKGRPSARLPRKPEKIDAWLRRNAALMPGSAL